MTYDEMNNFVSDVFEEMKKLVYYTFLSLQYGNWQNYPDLLYALN